MADLVDEQQCDFEKDSIVIEPVYFEKKGWLHKYVDPKKMSKYSFYGAFCAVLFIYYIKLMSNPIIALIYTIGTTLVLAYSTFFDHSAFAGY